MILLDSDMDTLHVERRHSGWWRGAFLSGELSFVRLGLVHGSRRIPLSHSCTVFAKKNLIHARFLSNLGSMCANRFFLVLLAALLVLSPAVTSRWAAKAANHPTTSQGANKHFYGKVRHHVAHFGLSQCRIPIPNPLIHPSKGLFGN
jgi:hypothetical protein